MTRPRARQWQAAFIAHLAKTGNVSASANRAGIERSWAYQTRRKNERFRALWDDALEQAVDALEEEARRRAYQGVEEPVFWKGQQVSQVTKYSDTLLIFLLKAHRPEKFRENHHIEASGTVEVVYRRGKGDADAGTSGV